MQNMIMIKDITGAVTFGLEFPDNKYSGVLTAGSEDTITAPPCPNATYNKLLAVFVFEPGSLVWVAKNDTAEAPSGSAGTTTSEGNPAARKCNPGDTLSFITNDTSAEFGVTFYAIQ